MSSFEVNYSESVLPKARAFAAGMGPRLHPARARMLHNQIHTTQLIVLACERSNADLDEMVNELLAEAKPPQGTLR